MIRDLDALRHRQFDLLVVGGGIHGLCAAYDAAARGLSVALVDASDFGSGISFNHQRTIHGGLRALQHGDVRKCREQIAERRAWAQIAPHMLRPLPFLIGTYRAAKRSRLVLKAGLRVHDIIGRRRNDDVVPELHLPKGRLESAAATRKLFPGVQPAGLTGGAVWYDYQMLHADRLTWLVALAGAARGATLINYVSVTDPLKDNGAIVGARVRDELTGEAFDVNARETLLAAGAGLAGLHRRYGLTGAPPLVQAMNLLINRRAHDIALVAPTSAGRMLTAVPWRGGVLVGTGQASTVYASSDALPTPDDVATFLAEANAAFPHLQATTKDIRLVHHGLVPASVAGGVVDLLAEPQVLRHTSDSVKGVVSLVGVKYTTARLAAERAVDAVVLDLGANAARCRTGRALLPHGDIADAEGRIVETLRARSREFSPDILQHLSNWYGTEAPDVAAYACETGLDDTRLSPDSPVLVAEIAYAATHAMAIHLSDAVLRRTPLGSGGYPGDAAINAAADAMARVCAWDENRRRAEIALVASAYPRTHPN